MRARDDSGVILAPRRRTDWNEPPADEGGWQLNPGEAGDDE